MAGKDPYSVQMEETFSLFQDYLEGSASRPLLVLGERMAEEPVRDALEKSFQTLGYSDDPCTFGVLAPSIDAQALFLLVEGLDPLHVVACDSATTQRLAEAYRTTYAEDAAIRVFGRPSVAFRDLEALITEESGKRKAWELLKTLA